MSNATGQYIVIDINSDLEPIEYPIDTDDEIETARVALRDAGLVYEEIYAGRGEPDAYKTGHKLFAANVNDDREATP